MRQLSEDGFYEAARMFRTLGDPVRLKILDLLRQEGEQSVGRIAERIGCSQPNASRQLARLAESNIIARRKDGNCVHYFIEDPSIFELCETVCGRLERRATHRAGALFEQPQHTSA
jgi:DNA-binding transcriptional ArsR family regulator